MASIHFVMALALAGGVGLVMTALLLAANGIAHLLRRKPFTPDRRLLMAWPVTTVFLTAAILYWSFGVPDQRSYASPGGAYTVSVAFHADIKSLDCYRFNATLRDADSGDLLGEVEDTVRDVFITNHGNSICWETAILIEWDERDGARDRVRVVIRDMNTAYLLPSGESVFPLPSGASQ